MDTQAIYAIGPSGEDLVPIAPVVPRHIGAHR